MYVSVSLCVYRAATGYTEIEAAREHALYLQEWDLRQGRDHWADFQEPQIPPATHLLPLHTSRPLTTATVLEEVEKISLEAFLSGMRSVAHTRRCTDLKRDVARLKNSDDDNVDIASFWDITSDYYAARSSAALQKQQQQQQHGGGGDSGGKAGSSSSEV